MRRILFTVAFLAATHTAVAECKIEEIKWENWPDGKHIKVDGVTSCPKTRLDMAFRCDGEFMSSHFVYTDTIGGFSTFAAGQCQGEINVTYGFDSNT